MKTEEIIKILRETSFSLDWSLHSIVSKHTPAYKYNNTEKIKWVRTHETKQLT